MFLKYNLFAILWILLILILGLAPGDSMPSAEFWGIISFDKVAHFFVFAVLSFLLIVGFSKQYTFRFIRYHAQILAIGFGLFYGLIIEAGQLFISDRSFEWPDLLANSLGVLSGWLIFYVIYKA